MSRLRFPLGAAFLWAGVWLAPWWVNLILCGAVLLAWDFLKFCERQDARERR